jgi:hypothetical protein
MTDEEWLESDDPAEMMAYLRDATVSFRTRWQGWVTKKRFRISGKKLLWMAYACVERVKDVLPQGKARDAIECLVKQLSTLPEDEALRHLKGWLGQDEFPAFLFPGVGQWSVVFAALGTLRQLLRDPTSELGGLFHAASGARIGEQSAQADLVRCIFSGLFFPDHIDPAWLDAHDRAGARIAQTIHDENRFAELPVLADALEEAGCASEAILAHCRSGKLHARGCWVVDRILEKE